MENKQEDMRIRHTKQRIKATLIQLLHTTSINKISVTSLCKNAEITRSTFYCYYADAYEVLEEIENERFDTYVCNLQPADKNLNKTDVYEKVFDSISENIDTVKIIFSEKTGSTYYMNLYNRIGPYTMEKYKRKYPETEDHRRKMIVNFIINGGTSLIKQWIFDENRCSPRKAAETLVSLIDAAENVFKATPQL